MKKSKDTETEIATDILMDAIDDIESKATERILSDFGTDDLADRLVLLGLVEGLIEAAVVISRGGCEREDICQDIERKLAAAIEDDESDGRNRSAADAVAAYFKTYC